MTSTTKKYRCGQAAGHADWAAHLVGYLHADPDPNVRKALLNALVSAGKAYPLPPYAETAVADLVEEMNGADDLF
jgi:hypothetical protein